MAKNTCKLCSRRFASPRALSGHMRSHSLAAAAAAAAASAAAAAAAAAAAKQQISSASSASTSFTTADEDMEAGFKKPASIYTLRENPKRSLRGVDGPFSDRESEAESTPPPSKRASPGPAAWVEAEPVSSLSDATPEEDVALSLMKLSRDSWPSGSRFEVDYSDDGSDDDEDGYAAPPPPPLPRRAPAPEKEKRTQFQCTACKKVFRSYQALGGHRASNVRGGRGGCCPPPVAPLPPPPQQLLPPSPLPEQQQQTHGGDDVDAKHECPYCYRVFSSGQALGGHKRSHVCGAAAAAAAQQHAGSTSTSAAVAPPPINNPGGMIDLNVLPPSEEVELSAVSDPHYNPGS
ncbi:hypothetical protein QOZ80_2AG0139880 [Eleusine coracana subsp. coracana]|nr:hypothetical protein QOZ80_2AG0139880 [Eleusine coracana subsp. coracana]